ncbi:MFS transporter [Virgibacillus halodenitrificans]|uniref:MFS transporter n=1 Tax=Virgibacillus halodenitrificans TaxID=1482 RepID=UPI0024C0BB5E|nr:MFS transporter [Virgibacillus halodenitrificans]WHX25428.1 MFS transporter [Virgibacillus halodenitrificans]
MSLVKNKIHFAWFVLVGLCITVGLGKAALNNTAGLFLSPVSNEIGVGVGNLTLYLSISSVVTMIFLPVGGKLMAKYDARVVLTGAIILQAGSFAMFGLMNYVWGWYIAAVPLGIGGVIITVIAGPILIERWFTKRKGLALGIMTAIGGVMGAFIQPVAGNLISNLGWRSSYFAIGIAVIVIVVPTIIFMLRQNPKEKGLLPYGEEGNINDKKEGSEEAKSSGIEFKDARKSIAFLLLGLFFFIVTAVASFSQHIPTYLVNQGYDIAFAGNIMAATMLGVFAGSLTFGYLADKIGAKNTALIAMGIGLVSVILLLIFPDVVTMLIIAVTMFGFMGSSIGTIAPAMASALFGGREYSQIYSTASMGLAIAGIVALPAYGYIFDFTGSYVSGFYTIIIMLLINIMCIIVAFRNKEKMVKENLWHSEG